MPVIFLYLFKLSLSLIVVYLFYHFILRRLTFYNWNRFFLIAYTALSFFIPFINITPVLERNEMVNNKALQFIPSFTTLGYANNEMPVSTNSAFTFSLWDWTLLLFAAGVLVMLTRMLIQLFSFRKMVNKATLISNDSVKLYQVNQSIIPFSFGNSIFINKQQHDQKELEEIIRHEFVHIRQKHTVDIIWSELLCILNWYNPFVWIIRKSIRQNLEFIADDKVLQSGIDKKQYQYLLLKVTGNNYFSIASQFNFSSLKKRIAMMNKMKSARVHLVKFLFVLPLIAILLVAFRNNKQAAVISKDTRRISVIGEQALNLLPINAEPLSDSMYIIEVIVNKKRHDTTIVIRDKNKKEVKRMSLSEWKNKQEHYEKLYGSLSNIGKATNYVSTGLNETSKQYEENFFKGKNQPMVILDGVKQPENTDPGSLLEPAEIFEMTVWKAEDAIAKYGYNAKNGVVVLTSRVYAGRTIEEIASTTTGASLTGAPVITTTTNYVTGIEKPVEVTASGITTNEMPEKPAGVGSKGFGTLTEASPTIATTAKSSIAATVKPVQATVSAKSPLSVTVSKVATEYVSAVKEIKTEKNVIAVLKSSTTETEVKKIESDLKSKGYDFKINKVEFKNGKLVLINGTISKNSKKQSFRASDFAKLVITDVPEEDKDNRFNFMVMSGNLNVSEAE